MAMSEGEYVAKAADCAACHTSSTGANLAGGVRFATPLGEIYSTNITPDPGNGPGNTVESYATLCVNSPTTPC